MPKDNIQYSNSVKRITYSLISNTDTRHREI